MVRYEDVFVPKRRLDRKFTREIGVYFVCGGYYHLDEDVCTSDRVWLAIAAALPVTKGRSCNVSLSRMIA